MHLFTKRSSIFTSALGCAGTWKAMWLAWMQRCLASVSTTAIRPYTLSYDFNGFQPPQGKPHAGRCRDFGHPCTGPRWSIGEGEQGEVPGTLITQ